MKKLLVLTPYPNRSADTRYRISQYIPYLEDHGWQVTCKPFMDDKFFSMYNSTGKSIEKLLRTIFRLLIRIVDCLQARNYDVVFIHKEAFAFGPPLLERIVKNNQPNLIYDMDDAFWTHPTQFSQIGWRFRDSNRIQKIIRMSSLILAGNDYIADYAKKVNPNCIYFPTVLDMGYYTLREELPDDIITIGWVGRWSSQSYLYDLQPVFEKLYKEHPNIQFHFIGVGATFSMPNLPVAVTPWTLEREITDLLPIDIGIMPLSEDGYSKGKCGFKLLQYMSLGIPAVASPIGVNEKIITDGKNGFLAASLGEWFEKLSILVNDGKLRSKMGKSARRTVVENYSLDIYAPKLLELLNKQVVQTV
jgi:glycosyltransferase involved in cell wall biosynthesis